jgi:hypothetical protein
MPGSLLALVAKSDEDRHLTGNPQITFWNSAHKRHSNFAIQRYQITRPTSRLMSTSVEFKIESVGDLLRGLTLEIDLPNISDVSGIYTDDVGCAAIDKIEFIINGQVVQTLWGEWISIFQQLTESGGKQEAFNQLRGGNIVTTRAVTGAVVSGINYGNIVRIPLPFWFSRTSGVALPLVALKHTDVRVRALLRRFDQLVYRSTDPTSSISKFYGSVQLFADVVHLDREERATFVENPLEYLIETIQRNAKVMTAARNQLGTQSPYLLGTADPPVVLEPIPLQLSMPVKELVWVLQPQPSSAVCTNMSQNRWLEFPVNEYTPSGDAYVDLIQEVTLRVGGQSIFENEKADWFRLEQPLRYHNNVPTTIPSNDYKGIYVHSFAIRPEEYQPSGTLNFSAVDKAELILSLTRPSKNYQALVFAWGYNILRIQNGLGGLVYSY